MKDAPVTEQETAEGPKISFWEAFEEFVRECGKQNDWTDATYEKFAAVKNHLKEFRDELSFDTFTENGLNDYVDFLRNKKDMRRQADSLPEMVPAVEFQERVQSEHGL